MQLRTCFRLGAVSSTLVAFRMLLASSPSDLMDSRKLRQSYDRAGKSASNEPCVIETPNGSHRGLSKMPSDVTEAGQGQLGLDWRRSGERGRLRVRQDAPAKWVTVFKYKEWLLAPGSSKTMPRRSGRQLFASVKDEEFLDSLLQFATQLGFGGGCASVVSCAQRGWAGLLLAWDRWIDVGAASS